MKMTKKVFSFKFVFNILNRNFSIFIAFAIATALRFISSIACFLVANSTRPFSTGHQSVCDTGYPCKRDLRVCMALKLNRNLDNNIPTKPTKNLLKSEKAYLACFAVFSMLLSASKRCFERFSREVVCVVCCVPKASRGLPLLGTF